MATQLRVRYDNFGGGINEYSSPFLVSATESPYSKNADFQVPGKLKKALGYSSIGRVATSGTGGIKGLFSYDTEVGTHTLLAAFKEGLYSYTGTGWNTTSGALFSSGATVDVEAVNAFVDGQERVYMTEGHSSTLSFYNGTGTTSIANIYAKHIATYKAKLYLGNVKISSTSYPQRILYSPEGEDTFDTTNDIIDDMGEPITALRVYGGYLYIFTENKIGIFDGTTLSQITSVGGTTNARTVHESEGKLIWYNRNGVYIYAGAGIPTKISKRVQGYIDAITDSTDVSGGIDKFGRYFLIIKDITYNGESLSKVALIYDVLNNEWEVRTGYTFNVTTNLKSGGGFVTYAGDIDNDYVYQLDNGYALGTSGMPFEWRTTTFDMGKPEREKNIYKAIFSLKPNETSEWLTVQYKVDGASGWTSINGTGNNISLSGSNDIESAELFINQAQSKFIEFNVTNTSTSGGWEIYSIELEGDIND